MTSAPPQDPVAERSKALIVIRGLAGAIVGGVIGYVAFRWLAARGMYALMLPGALLGISAGLAARGQSQVLGVVCAVAALVLGVYAEWSVAPFKEDGTLLYFVTHLHQMDRAGFKLLILALGALCGWWFGRGR